jgi:CBS domain-containing membrane protein
MVTIEEVMSVNPVTLSHFNSLADARQLMQQKGFRHIPIVGDDGELLGLVSQRDVLSHGNDSQSLVDDEELNKLESGTLIADIMTTSLTTIMPHLKVENAAKIMHKYKFGCLPVVDKKNRLKGIITNHDFVEITIQLLEMMRRSESQELDEYQ